MSRSRLIATAIAFLFCLPAFAAAPHYQVVHKFLLGGDGGWDALTYDAAGKRLFISRSTRVMVVDVEKGTLIAEIPDTDGVHGIALAPDLGRGFTSNGKADSVTVFDLKTLKQTALIKTTGQNPDAIVYEPVSKRVFAFNGRSDNATVIDAAAGTVVATIALDGKPEFAEVDGQGKVYVNIEDKSELSIIDAQKATVLKTWSLAPCQEPSGIALDVKHHRLFSNCDDKLMAVSDVDAGKVVATLPIGEGVDGAGFDPGLGLAFSSNGADGTLTVVHQDGADKYSVAGTVPTQKFARTMTVDPVSHRVFLVTADVHVTPAPAGATGAAARPRRDVQPGTFTLLVLQPK